MRKKISKFILVLVSAVFMLGGCAAGPDYQEPETIMPAEWQYSLGNADCDSSAKLGDWWEDFDDPQLNMLVEAALEENLDLENAYLAIAESRAVRDFTAGQYYPNIDLAGSYRRIRESEKTYAGSAMAVSAFDNYSVGFDSSWEIDVFGKIKRSVQSAQAGLEATAYQYYYTRLSLISEVARAYTQLRTVQRRITLANKNVQTQQETLKLTRDRYQAGLAPELDVSQAQQNLANTKSQIPPLKQAKIEAENRLAVLVGKFAGTVEMPMQSEPRIPRPPENIKTVLPAELLRRRPDIRIAERRLAAQSAKIGVAAADLYPRFSISGTFAFDAEKVSDLGDFASRNYSFGPSVRWNIFDGERIKNTVKIEKIRSSQAMLDYDNTVLKAVEEVENALAGYALETERMKQLEKSVAAAQKSVKLVRDLYKNGLTDFQNVLDTQRTLFNQQDSLAQSRGQTVINLIALYKAIGGGWYEAAANTEAEPITEQAEMNNYQQEDKNVQQ